ncbi:MAG: hypothetical protein LBL24_09240 [Bacteroidales bacterium]|nr:hypothetical protein [Bacteroidales bacterium]
MNIKNIKSKGIIIWVLICVVLNFLFHKGIGIASLNTLVLIFLALYFSPIKPILEFLKLLKHKDINLKTVIFVFLSNFVLAAILSFTIIKFYMHGNTTVDTLSSLFVIFNAILAYYNLFVKDDKDAAFLHVIFLLFR